VSELAFLIRILQRAITTDQLPPENPGIVELGDEVAVEFANGYTPRLLVVSPIEAPLDDLNISVESPLGQALVGHRVGEQVEVDAPDGRFRCRILTTGRHQTAAASRPKTSGSWVMEGGMGRVRPLPPGKIRYEGDRPVALLAVPVAPSFRLVNLPLGLPTTTARTSRGTWALYPIGAEVVVVHPDGAVSGPAAEVAAEVGRLATRDRQGDLDRQAAWTIQRLLTGDGPARPSPGRLGARTWTIPAKAYWLSGPDNHHRQAAAGTPDRPEPSQSIEPATSDRATPVASPPGPASTTAALGC
jgi:hypothetical protein